MLVALAPALVAVPAAARDGAPTGSPAPAAAATIAVDARAMLMAEATVHDGDAELPARGLLALPGAERRTLSVLLPMDGVPLGQAYALPSIPAPPAVWNILLETPRKSRLDAAPIERMSLEGTADYSRSRAMGLDARLELCIDGRADSAMVRLGGRLAGMLRTLERR
ncbi:hypothetical protein [Sphingomonas sp.]|jgi:hypothetical protein|uniref:hypothetical protein n=1 Tax=Sphingomonas sp. TaxID=28214 RepID=UPI0026146B66|nr:hypothetical protein [Sphingomonas sp.]MDK2769058.1 hypothetical protein [Sphingomonas sp.]